MGTGGEYPATRLAAPSFERVRDERRPHFIWLPKARHEIERTVFLPPLLDDAVQPKEGRYPHVRRAMNPNLLVLMLDHSVEKRHQVFFCGCAELDRDVDVLESESRNRRRFIGQRVPRVFGDALNLLTYFSLYASLAAISAPRLTDLLTATVEIFNWRANAVMLMPSSRTAQKHNKLRALTSR